MANKVTVTINGNEYIIKGEESADEIMSIASYVDNEIKKINDQHERFNPTFAAVLAALNITNELFKCQKEYENITVSCKDYEKQLEELKREYNNVLKENAKLQEQCGNAFMKIDKSDEEFDTLKNKYENLHDEYMKKDDELAKAYKENELLAREKDNKQKELDKVKLELSESKYKLVDLQNQLLQNQIDLVKANREFDKYKLNGRNGNRA
ncbi:MAG TPA: hypothetical protein DD429_10595 [Clostridiaceae bacterium]|jgi:cell division protein ZapA|nr:hypothetical protein [Clostridiaceae bacterium]